MLGGLNESLMLGTIICLLFTRNIYNKAFQPRLELRNLNIVSVRLHHDVHIAASFGNTGQAMRVTNDLKARKENRFMQSGSMRAC